VLLRLRLKKILQRKCMPIWTSPAKRGTPKNAIMKSVPKTLPGDERRIWDDRQGELRVTKDPRDKLDAKSLSLLDIACVG
jgi:hypothetical protein